MEFRELLCHMLDIFGKYDIWWQIRDMDFLPNQMPEHKNDQISDSTKEFEETLAKICWPSNGERDCLASLATRENE